MHKAVVVGLLQICTVIPFRLHRGFAVPFQGSRQRRDGDQSGKPASRNRHRLAATFFEKFKENTYQCRDDLKPVHIPL